MDIQDKKQALKAKIDDLELSLNKLKSQLKEIEHDQQHHAIDNLEQYLGELDHKYDNLRSFWMLLKEEITEIINKDKTEM